MLIEKYDNERNVSNRRSTLNRPTIDQHFHDIIPPRCKQKPTTHCTMWLAKKGTRKESVF